MIVTLAACVLCLYRVKSDSFWPKIEIKRKIRRVLDDHSCFIALLFLLMNFTQYFIHLLLRPVMKRRM